LDPDVVLTDHSLPGFGARDAMRIVGQIRPGTPVIVVTGALGDEPAVEYLQAGAADYVLKDDLKRLGPAVLRALDGKRSREDQGRAQRLQEATFKIAQVALATPQLETLLPAVHQIIRELMPAEDFYIALHDPATDTLAFPYHVDKYDGVRTFDMPAQTRPVGKTLTDYVLRTRSALLATSEVQRDLERQGLVQPRGTPAVDWLGVPLVVGERVIGVLVAQSYSTDVRLGEREKHILEFVSGQVAMGITRSRAEADLRASQARLTAIIDTA